MRITALLLIAVIPACTGSIGGQLAVDATGTNDAGVLNENDANENDANENDANDLDANENDANDFDANDLDANENDANENDANENDANDLDANDLDANDFDANEIDANDFDAEVADADPDATTGDATTGDATTGDATTGDATTGDAGDGGGGDGASADAGPDTGPRDAAPRDAGDAAAADAALDAALDAAAPDTGAALDAAAPDAAAPDAAAPDAAAPDAAAPDAAAPDTGPWRPFNSTSPWNTPIPASPAIDPDSAAMIAHLSTSSIWPWLDIAIAQYSVPLYFIDSTTTPLVPVNILWLAGDGFRTMMPSAPIPTGAAAAMGTDRHLCLVDRTLNIAWDFWNAQNMSGAWSCGVCSTSDLAGSGVRPHPQQTMPNWWSAHGARACGFPLNAGLITVHEMQAGRIEHALVIGYPGIRSRYYKDPASTAQATRPPLSQTMGIPCGGRIQLDPAVDVYAISGLTASGRTILIALQEYGAYVGDYNGSISLYADAHPDARAIWSGGLLRTEEVRNRFNLTDLRVLELGPLFDDGN